MSANFDSRSATRTPRSTARERDFHVRACALMPAAAERATAPGAFFWSEYQERGFAVTRGSLHRVQHDRLVGSNDLPVMVWESNEDGLLDYYSRRVYDYSGTTPAQLMGTGWISIVHPDDRRRATQRWSISVATGDPLEIEFRIRAYDGNYRWFLVQANSRRDPDDDATRWLGTCTDIDHCMSAARRSQGASRVHDDERLHAEACAGLQQLGMSATHALRQPLTAILSNAQALQAMLKPHVAVDPEIQEILADIVQEDKRAVDIL